MKPIIKVCVDRRPTPKTYNERLALLNEYKWPKGGSLHIRFLDGIGEIQEKVKKYALEWCEYANLQIYFDDNPQAPIRISFKRRGSWSYIGTDCKNISDQTAPTINFGWLTPESTEEEYSGVVLHEFGHALGCIHEHSSPASGIPWNKDAVYEYYSGDPNFWTKEEVDRNVFETYSETMTSFSQFDKDSIMIYPIPKELTIGGFEVGWNVKLSQTDKDFIHKMYP